MSGNSGNGTPATHFARQMKKERLARGWSVVQRQGLPARDFRVAAFTAELFAIQRRHNVFISSEFAAPVFALLTIKEQVREWAPVLDFQVVVQAIIISSIALIPCGV